MIRVVLVDDSPVVISILSDILSSEPDLMVVGHAKDGAQGVDLVRRLRPDVVLMDVRMPVMDGIEATAAIMADAPTPILIVAAAVTEDTGVAFRAIQAGAIDVVAKPEGTLTSDYAKLELIRRVKLVARVTPIRRGRPRATPEDAGSGATDPTPAGPASRAAGPVVAIGASTGGPPALAAVLGTLAARARCPVLAVQHISAGFLEGLVEWLRTVVPLDVRVAERGQELAPGAVLFAPEGHHLGLSRDGRVALSRDPPRDGHRPSASHLFESVAAACGPRAIGVLLTGMGRDGADGLKLMRQAGAPTIAQDEASSVVWGMPRAAVELGAASRVLPLEEIGPEVARLVAGRAAGGMTLGER